MKLTRCIFFFFNGCSLISVIYQMHTHLTNLVGTHKTNNKKSNKMYSPTHWAEPKCGSLPQSDRCPWSAQPCTLNLRSRSQLVMSMKHTWSRDQSLCFLKPSENAASRAEFDWPVRTRANKHYFWSHLHFWHSNRSTIMGKEAHVLTRTKM